MGGAQRGTLGFSRGSLPSSDSEAQVSRCAQRVFRQARNECADGHLRTISRADAMSFDAWHAPGLVNEERACAMWARVDSIDSWTKREAKRLALGGREKGHFPLSISVLINKVKLV